MPSDFTPLTAGKQAPPGALSVQSENIPPELKQRRQWVVWNYYFDKKRGKWTKPPYDAQTGKLAATNDPSTWRDFDTAWRAYETGAWAGVGYVFTEDDPFVGVDLDDCRNPETGVVEPWAASILAELDTYAEISPSRTGIKAICRGTLPEAGANKPNGWPVEVYKAVRYFTFTGHVWLYGEIKDAQPAIDALWERIHAGPPPFLPVADNDIHRKGETPPKPVQPTTGHPGGGMDDASILATIARSDQGAKFARLMAGDTSGHPGKDGKPDASAADAALVGMLVFYTRDAGQLDRIFRQSGLYRPKWDERHYSNGDTYGQRTIDFALSKAQGQPMHDPKYRSANHRSAAQPPTEPPDLPSMPAEPPPSPDDVLAALARGELGDAELLAKRYAGRIAYDHSEERWHVWAGHSWERDERRTVDALPGTKLAALYLTAAADAAKSDDRSLASALGERARVLWRRNRIANVLHLAARQDALSLSGREWDAKPWLLAVKNGVIDLQKGDLRPGQPGDYLRTQAPTAWKGIDAPAPRWERFLAEVFDNDTELIAFVQRLLGYAITGKSSEHVLPILWGKGRNGKDTLLKALAYTLGPGFADAVPDDVFIDAGRANGGSAQPHVYKLRGLRLAWASESEEGARLKAGQVKMISGGGILTARPLYGAPVSWEASHTVMLITNHRPHVSADDYAMWKRIVLIPFALSFVDEPKDANERQRDPNLDARLKAEAPGILAWLVRGCLAWQREGLRPPATVKTATESYRTDEDTLGQWLAECCIVGDGCTCKALSAYESYAAWCKAMNVKPMWGNTFGKKLAERFTKEHTRNGWQYVGIGLLTDQNP